MIADRENNLVYVSDLLEGRFPALSARFQKVTWKSLLGAIEQPPGWLVGYAAARGYAVMGEVR